MVSITLFIQNSDIKNREIKLILHNGFYWKIAKKKLLFIYFIDVLTELYGNLVKVSKFGKITVRTSLFPRWNVCLYISVLYWLNLNILILFIIFMRNWSFFFLQKKNTFFFLQMFISLWQSRVYTILCERVFICIFMVNLAIQILDVYL